MRKERIILFFGIAVLLFLGIRFELAHSKRVLQFRDPRILATATNPKTSTNELRQLISYPNCEVRRALVLHPHLSKIDLEVLSKTDPDLGVRYEAKKKLRFFRSLKKRFSPPADISLEKTASSCLLTNEIAHQVYKVAMQQRDFSRIELLIALAKNPKTPTDILQTLAQQKNLLILRSLAANPALSYDLQSYLVEYPDCKVRKKLLCQPVLSGRFIRRLENDNDNSVALEANRRYRAEDHFLDDCKKTNSIDTSCKIFYNQASPIVRDSPSTSDSRSLSVGPFLSWR